MRTIYTHFRYKEPALEVQPCVIEKVVELSAERYSYFCRHLTEDYDFIHECAEEQYKDGHGINHCLLVLGAGSRDGILVRSEGYDWARYHAYLPNARQIVDMDRHPSLDEMNQEVVALVDKYAKLAVDCQLDGRYRISLDDIRNSSGNTYCQDSLIAEMLSERPELELVEEGDNELYLFIAPEYVVVDNNEGMRQITKKDLDIICAKHVLWINGVGGEPADFSNCILEHLDLSGRNLEQACFENAKLVGCHLYRSNIKDASFQWARIHDCEMTDMQGDGATFADARIRGTDMSRSHLEGTNFSRASFAASDITTCHMANSCFDGTDFGDVRLDSAYADQASFSEQDWLGEEVPGMQM